MKRNVYLRTTLMIAESVATGTPQGSLRPSRFVCLCLIALGLAALGGCNAASSHTAYLSLPESNAVAAFRIDNGSAKFTQIVGSPYLTGTSPGPLVVNPAKTFLYVANRIDDTISRFKIDSSIGSLTEVAPRVSTGLTPSDMVMNGAGTFLFVVNQISSNISVYSIDSASGALTQVPGSPFSTAPNPVTLAVTPSSKFLYVVDSNLALVFGYAIGASGTLQQIPNSPFAVGNGPLAIAIDPGEHFLYVVNSSDGTVTIASINSSTGALSEVVGSPFGAGTTPIALCVSPNRQYLYIANQGSSNITGYTMDLTTGFPTLITGSPFGGGGAPALIVSDPNGNFVYTVSQTSSNITVLSVTAGTGVLAATSESASTSVAAVSMFVTK